MTCPRCRGFMVEDHFIDLQETMGPHWVTAMRCMNCGNVIDPVMAVNRLWADSIRAMVTRPVSSAEIVLTDEQQAA